MNKFTRVVLGLKALLGRMAPSSAVTDTQLDWDNFKPSEEEQAVWEEMAKELFCCADCGKKGDYHWCRFHQCEEHCACGKGMKPGAAVCDFCLEESEFVTPAVCKGCGKKDYKVLLDFCYDCETNGTEFRIRSGESLSDAVDRHAKAPSPF